MRIRTSPGAARQQVAEEEEEAEAEEESKAHTLPPRGHTEGVPGGGRRWWRWVAMQSVFESVTGNGVVSL